MRRITIIVLLLLLACPLFALSTDEITSENLVSLLSDAGYAAYVDEDGDVAFEDQYGFVYYMIHIPEDRRLWIQCSWYASDSIDSITAFRLMNECNANLAIVRGWYVPIDHTFFWDYDLLYGESGLDEGLLVSVIDAFIQQSDILTDFLISEGA